MALLYIFPSDIFWKLFLLEKCHQDSQVVLDAVGMIGLTP